jgi:hypothetical protein
MMDVGLMPLRIGLVDNPNTWSFRFPLSYPGLEITAKLAAVLEAEAAQVYGGVK